MALTSSGNCISGAPNLSRDHRRAILEKVGAWALEFVQLDNFSLYRQDNDGCHENVDWCGQSANPLSTFSLGFCCSLAEASELTLTRRAYNACDSIDYTIEANSLFGAGNSYKTGRRSHPFFTNLPEYLAKLSTY